MIFEPSAILSDKQLLTKSVDVNLETLKDAMFQSDDIKERMIHFKEHKILIVFLDSMVDKLSLETNVLEPIIELSKNDSYIIVDNLFPTMISIIKAVKVKSTNDLAEIVNGLREGYCVLFLKNQENAILVGVPISEDRSLVEPESEKIIKGSRDGFTESMDKNIYSLQKRNKSENLVVKEFTVGIKTKTKVKILYIHDLVNSEVLCEVTQRIQNIKVDKVQSSGELEELIEDNGNTLFPQILTTERPDRASSYLLDGKVIVIVEQSPQVLILPITFFSFYQSPDDYNSRWLLGSFFRLIRLLSFIIAISLPAIYISVVSFHSEILPIGLLYSLSLQTEFVPLSPFLEAITMQIILELLKEASIRLPSPISQTIGIVGGLVIGTAIVEAGIVSNVMIVVIALTAIASFVAPVNQMGTGVRVLAFPIMILANFFGFLGISISLTILIIHLCKLESFKSPYLYPLAPLDSNGIKDTFVRTKKKNYS